MENNFGIVKENTIINVIVAASIDDVMIALDEEESAIDMLDYPGAWIGYKLVDGKFVSPEDL